MINGRLNIMGHDISYTDNNVDNAPVILLIHGNSSSKQTFHFQFQSKEMNKYRLLAFDFPGHGESSPCKDLKEYSLIHFSELIIQFIERLKLNQVVLAGHSMGGHAAIEALEIQNERIVGLFTWNTPPVARLEDIPSALPSNPYSPITLPEITELAQAMKSAKEMAPKASLSELEGIAQQIVSTAPLFRSSFLNSIAGRCFKNEVAILQTLSIPYTIAISEFDSLVSSTYVQKLSLNRPLNEYYITLAEVGHYAHLENAPSFNRHLLSFLEKCLK